MASISGPDWSKLSSLDPELIRAFVAVVDTGGFTSAARQLHRTQSTISLRIRTLEERLGTPLVLRGGRRLALSRDGENFLIHARRIIQVQSEAIAALNRSSSSQRVIRFGLPEDYAELWLPDLLKRFHELRPGVQPHIHCRMSLELLDRLNAGELDLALVVRHGPRPGGHPLGSESVVWAAHRDFRLDQQASVPLALFPETCCYRQRGLAALADIDRPCHIVYTSQSPTGIRIAVNHRAAVTIIDRCTLPANWRVLDANDGLPPLPPADLELHLSSGIHDPSTDDLAALIASMVEERRRSPVEAA
ncbi:DNA-binding transcriptional LysR family regulator [Burkholderia sp. PvR073]|nr:LysR family transcriptional regulator [Burkholderia sp. B21-007]UEP44418.1 LysR family transcriptional regulator [Burkholderia sp. B21-005]